MTAVWILLSSAPHEPPKGVVASQSVIFGPFSSPFLPLFFVAVAMCITLFLGDWPLLMS